MLVSGGNVGMSKDIPGLLVGERPVPALLDGYRLAGPGRAATPWPAVGSESRQSWAMLGVDGWALEGLSPLPATGCRGDAENSAY